MLCSRVFTACTRPGVHRLVLHGIRKKPCGAVQGLCSAGAGHTTSCLPPLPSSLTACSLLPSRAVSLSSLAAPSEPFLLTRTPHFPAACAAASTLRAFSSASAAPGDGETPKEVESENTDASKGATSSAHDAPPDAGEAADADAQAEEVTKRESKRSLLPREVVAELERFIVGQDDAKKAVAIALRNRWRRRQLSPELQAEVMPKNILMIGPTGVGKTEIARRLAKLCQAPFIKVEATKFTEVGFHGRDVDQIIRDLTDIGIQQHKQFLKETKDTELSAKTEEHILGILTGSDASPITVKEMRELLRAGEMEEREIELDLPDESAMPNEGNVPDFLAKMMTHMRSKKRKMKVKDARPLIKNMEADKLVSQDSFTKDALQSIETDGIVFIDEIDKICTSHHATKSGADASDEGVQRDLLPLIEGSVVSTKHGTVDTSKILFIASGAFYGCKPSDLLPELQGRLPIRVELKPLNMDDLHRILTEPEANLITQQIALMKAEDIDMTFSDAAVRQIAKIAAEVNETVENIGARRLHTIVEKIMEDFSFNCDKYTGQQVEVDEKMVKETLKPMLVKTDLSKFVL